MSAIFQRPLCEMGAAYDFSFRPLVGDPETGAGGGCDDYPHRVELYSAATDPRSSTPEWRAFSLCPEHENQLRRYDQRLTPRGIPTRFRVIEPSAARGEPRGRGAR